MERLIDANALKKEAWPERYTGEGIIYVEDVDKAPTVDAVEVVRCKDCVKRGNDEECPMLSIMQYTEADDFCSYGERRPNVN